MNDYRLYIKGVEIDLDDKVVFPITYAQSDAKNPEKRKRNASKTIVAPGTINNRKFFASAFNLSLSDVYGLFGFDFNPTLRYPSYVTRNGKRIFNGAANLKKVVLKNGVPSFHIVLFSSIIDLFQALGDLKVSELGWSEYDHTLSVSNIQASWTASTGSGYVYPLIHYGFTSNLLRYKTNELFPFVYIKEAIEKCFAVAGLSVSSVWLNTPLIKKIIWGFGGGETLTLNPSEISSRQVNLEIDNPTTNIYGGEASVGPGLSRLFNFIKTIEITDPNDDDVEITEVSDPSNQFNKVIGELDVANEGDYRVTMGGEFTFTYQFPFLDTPPSEKAMVFEIQVRIFKNFSLVGSQTFNINEEVNSGSEVLVLSFVQDFTVDSGDIFTFDVNIDTFGTFMSADGTTLLGGVPTMNYQIDFNDSFTIDFEPINLGLVDGETVNISRFLPDMKASDFLKDMFNMFNLQFSDPNHSGNVVLEPADSYFFDTDEAEVYSDKLDHSKDIEILSGSRIEGKTYQFKFAEDNDFYKSKYLEYYGKSYGDHSYDVASTFQTKTKTYQLSTAQSCPVQIPGANLIIPMIITRNETTLIDSPYKGKARIFFYNGLESSDTWQLENSDTGALTNLTSYPQAHHLDDLSNPTFDLNFGVPIRLFYVATTYTNDNLFQRHHVDFLRELTSIDSKVMRAFFKVDEEDLYENFMRYLVNVEGVMFRKNLVNDYRVDDDDTTQFELLKLIRPRSQKDYQEAIDQVFEPNLDGPGQVDDDTTADDQTSTYYADASGVQQRLNFLLDGDRLTVGKVITVKKMDSSQNNVRIAPTGQGVTIDGATSYNLTNQYQYVRLQWDGSNFNIVG